MKKSLKILGLIVLAVVILVVVGVAAICLYADSALKIGIEAAGSKALNVGVTVEDVDLSILGGKVRFQNLSIDNPPGYKHERLLELGDAQIEVDTRSLLGDVVKIRQIKLDGMTLVLEQRGISGNNLQDVIKSIPSGGEAPAEPSGKKLHIDNLEITNVTVKMKLLSVVPGKADTITLKLKPIKMTDLGSDNKLDAAALSGKVLLAVAGGVAQQGADVLPEEIVGPLTGELKKLGKLPEALLKEGTDLGKDVLEEGKDIGKEIGDAFKGLLAPKKEKSEETTP